MSDPSTRFLDISRVSRIFPTPNGPQTVVKGFDLRVGRGEFVSIIGHSGCGKSTVLAMLAGLARPDEGGILLDDREITAPGPDRGVVFQAPSLLPWRTARQNVLLGLEEVKPKSTSAERSEIAAHYLELVGLGGALDKMPAELSQGMRQRVGLARAFALSPRMLLLDEPFGMLDALTRIELQDVLVDLWTRYSMTAVMVTHDVDEAIFLSDKVVMMTSSPEAHVGEVVPVPFDRPRDRRQIVEDPRYLALRERIVGFLEEQDHHRPKAPAPEEPVADESTAPAPAAAASA